VPRLHAACEKPHPQCQAPPAIWLKFRVQGWIQVAGKGDAVIIGRSGRKQQETSENNRRRNGRDHVAGRVCATNRNRWSRTTGICITDDTTDCAVAADAMDVAVATATID